jgi:hypothetical protein
LFGNSGLAQAFESGLDLGEIRWVVAHRRPGGAGAGESEGRVEREAGLDGGTRLVQSTKLREGDAQHKMWKRIISVGLDRPSTPADRLVVKAEVVLRRARNCHPDVSHRIAWTEAQGLGNVGLCFFGATDKDLTSTDN